MNRRAALAAAVLVLAAVPLEAQAPGDTVTVVPAARYRAGALKRALLGRSYRDLWTTPVRVPVLDLDAFAGGLEPTEEGGSNQTLSLRFLGADGREYAFRSVDKFPGRRAGTLPGPAGAVVQDQVSAQLPGGAVVAARLMDVTGAPHVEPGLYVMPDDPRLGAFRARFAGMLGTLEERARDGFAGADEVEGTDDFLEALEESAGDRVDAREYLAVRLLDLVMGDWDRHDDQYRWARFDTGGTRLWRPVPRDRDYVFVDYDGFLLDLVRPMLVKMVRFGPRIANLYGLLEQSQFLDRKLLGELERPAWDSVAAGVRARLTDRLIDDAVARLPAEHRALRGPELAARLRARRDALPAVAEEFYRVMAREAEVWGTDEAEVARVERLGAEGVEVRLHRGADPGGEPHFRRRYLVGETREVRIFLRGGDDRAVVTGDGPTLVRVVGGAGDDTLEDRGTGPTALYDDRGENAFVRGRRTRVDTRPYEAPEWELGVPGAGGPPRDWGSTFAPLAPHAALRPHAGVVVGVGPRRTRYGFRRHPDAVDGWARVLWSPAHGRFGVEARHQRRWTGTDAYGYLFGRASALEAIAFRGFGNDSPELAGDRRPLVWERQLLAEGGVVVPRPGGVTLSAAGVVRRTDPAPTAGFAPHDPALPGLGGAWSVAGARAGVRVDRRVPAPVPRRGWTLAAEGALLPLRLEGEERAHARSRVVATGYLPLGPGPVLAARAGGEAVWGDFPVQHAVFLGDGATLRGYRLQRFAGDRSAFGSVELRQRVTGPVGVLALADAGRVWHRGASPGGWHTAVGAGAWAAVAGRVVSATVAYGETTVGYLGFSLPF